MYEINLVFLIFFYKRGFWFCRPAMVSRLVVKRHLIPKDAVEEKKERQRMSEGRFILKSDLYTCEHIFPVR